MRTSHHCGLYMELSVWPAWACPKYPGLATFLLPPILIVLQAICLLQTASSLPIVAAVAFPPMHWIKLTDHFISIAQWRCGATDGPEVKIRRTSLLNIFYQVVCPRAPHQGIAVSSWAWSLSECHFKILQWPGCFADKSKGMDYIKHHSFIVHSFSAAAISSSGLQGLWNLTLEHWMLGRNETEWGTSTPVFEAAANSLSIQGSKKMLIPLTIQT